MSTHLPIILALLLCAVFFNATEIAVTMASRVRLRTRAERGARGAARAERLLLQPERAIATCLLGNTLAQVGIAAYGRAALMDGSGFDEVTADVVTTAVLVPLVLVFGEAIPKALGQMIPNRMLSALALPLRVVEYVLWPLAQVSFAVVALVRRIAGLRSELRDVLSREELKRFIAHSEKHGHVDDTERDLIARIVEFWRADPVRFGKRIAEVPHLGAQTPVGEAKEWLRARRLSRLLVVNGPEKVAGVVTAAALADAPNSALLGSYAQPVVALEPGHGADRVLAELQRSPSQVGVIRDAGGGPPRVLLLDDLLRHLLGTGRGFMAHENA